MVLRNATLAARIPNPSKKLRLLKCSQTETLTLQLSIHPWPAFDRARPHLDDPVSLLNLACVGTEKPVRNGDLSRRCIPSRGGGRGESPGSLTCAGLRTQQRTRDAVGADNERHTGSPPPVTAIDAWAYMHYEKTHDILVHETADRNLSFLLLPQLHEHSGNASRNKWTGIPKMARGMVHQHHPPPTTLLSAHQKWKVGHRTGHDLGANAD